MTIQITRQQHDRLIMKMVRTVASARHALKDMKPGDPGYEIFQLKLLQHSITLAALEQKPFAHACEVKLFRGSPRTETETCGPGVKGAFPLFTRIFEVKP